MPLLRKFLIFLIICGIFFSQFSVISAASPNLLIYPVKRISEETKLMLLLSYEQKKEYFYQLFDKRIKELIYITESKKEGFIIFTADRYNSFAGRLKEDYPPDITSRAKFKEYLKILEQMRDRYPANSLYWEKLQQSVDTTKSLL